MPTAREFAFALKELGRPRGRQLKFLRAHYSAHKRALNMRKLAAAAGYRSYGGVNLQYGKLADRIARVLNHRTPPTAVFLLVEFIPPRQASNAEYILVMRSAFARGLELAGWV
jgi:hypothetical protein